MEKRRKQSVYFFSGPCGCGKSTLADSYAKKLVKEEGVKQVYVIHGDDFQSGFVRTDDGDAFFADGKPSNFLVWEEILKFNWECILETAGKALRRGLDVVIDYVIEDELPLVRRLAEEYGAELYYVVLTASEETLRQRITGRGDTELIDRSLFLKKELDNRQENRGHLFDNTEKTVEQTVQELRIEDFKVPQGVSQLSK